MYEESVRKAVGSLRLGSPMREGGLCVVPLHYTAEVGARYVLLEQAVERRNVRQATPDLRPCPTVAAPFSIPAARSQVADTLGVLGNTILDRDPFAVAKDLVLSEAAGDAPSVQQVGPVAHLEVKVRCR